MDVAAARAKRTVRLGVLSSVRVRASFISDRLEDSHDALSAGSADRDQAPACSLLGQLFGQGCHDASASGAEGVARRQRGTVDVDLASVYLTERGICLLYTSPSPRD